MGEFRLKISLLRIQLDHPWKWISVLFLFSFSTLEFLLILELLLGLGKMEKSKWRSIFLLQIFLYLHWDYSEKIISDFAVDWGKNVTSPHIESHETEWKKAKDENGNGKATPGNVISLARFFVYFNTGRRRGAREDT